MKQENFTHNLSISVGKRSEGSRSHFPGGQLITMS